MTYQCVKINHANLNKKLCALKLIFPNLNFQITHTLSQINILKLSYIVTFPLRFDARL